MAKFCRLRWICTQAVIPNALKKSPFIQTELHQANRGHTPLFLLTFNVVLLFPAEVGSFCWWYLRRSYFNMKKNQMEKNPDMHNLI